MIARAPHYTIVGEDGTKTLNPAGEQGECWDISISGIIQVHSSCWTYVKPAGQRSRYGRVAYQNLYQHFLVGLNNIDYMAMQAKDKLKFDRLQWPAKPLGF